jgi:hypothetical protein
MGLAGPGSRCASGRADPPLLQTADRIAVDGSKVHVARGGAKQASANFEGEAAEIPQGFSQGAFTIEASGAGTMTPPPTFRLPSRAVCFHTVCRAVS